MINSSPSSTIRPDIGVSVEKGVDIEGIPIEIEVQKRTNKYIKYCTHHKNISIIAYKLYISCLLSWRHVSLFPIVSSERYFMLQGRHFTQFYTNLKY